MRNLLVPFCLCLLILASPAQAVVVVSNLANTPNSTAGTANTADVIFTSTAQSFNTGAGSALLDSVRLAMANGSPTGSFTLGLYNDVGGSPGTLQVNLSGDMTPIDAGEYDYEPDVPFTLDASTTYWVVADPVVGNTNWRTTEDTSETGATGWTLGDAAKLRQVIFGNDGGWIAITQSAQMAIFATVPEASSFAFFAVAAAATSFKVMRPRRRCA